MLTKIDPDVPNLRGDGVQAIHRQRNFGRWCYCFLFLSVSLRIWPVLLLMISTV